jgi:hypothetical protein
VKRGATMKDTPTDLGDATWQALNGALGAVPFLELDAVGGWIALGRRRGAEWEIRIPRRDRRQPLHLLIEARRSGEPRFARDAVNQLLVTAGRKEGRNLVFAAPYIAPASRRLCHEAGVGWIDFSGNYLLSFEGVYVSRSGEQNAFLRPRELRSVYGARSERILRALLQAPARAWRLVGLATAAGVSLGLVAKVKQRLLDREWAAAGGDGLRLVEPRALLLDWAGNYDAGRNEVSRLFGLGSVAELENRMARACTEAGLRFAFTGFSAASRLAPFVRYQQVSAYVTGSLDALSGALELKSGPGATNVELLRPYDDGVLMGCDLIGGSAVVSPLQAFLDLYSIKGRGREAAEFLLKEVIEKRWSEPPRTMEGKASKRRGRSSSS